MYRKELNERSPLRLFEHSIHGGLGRGNVGVVVARHGIGKTAFLVGIALDDAMRERKVLHVSLDNTVDHIREFYDEIFMDLAHAAHHPVHPDLVLRRDQAGRPADRLITIPPRPLPRTFTRRKFL